MPIGKCIVVGDSVWDLLAALGHRRSAWVCCREATVEGTRTGGCIPYLP